MLRVWLAIVAVGVMATVPRVAGAQAPAASTLQIVAVDVAPAGRGPRPTEPAAAVPDTLYALRIRLRNGGTDPANDLSFQVTVSGQRLAPYLNHSFKSELPPGKETEVSLYNFWSSEAGRPFPKDGRLVVDVQLTGARWTPKTGAVRDVQPLPRPFSVTLNPRAGK
jgi:hypothetical protein